MICYHRSPDIRVLVVGPVVVGNDDIVAVNTTKLEHQDQGAVIVLDSLGSQGGEKLPEASRPNNPAPVERNCRRSILWPITASSALNQVIGVNHHKGDRKAGPSASPVTTAVLGHALHQFDDFRLGSLGQGIARKQ